MVQTAEIFINLPVKSIAKAYTYLVPEAFSFLAPGWRVLVPFGPRQAEGFVVAVAEASDAEGLREILDLVDREPWFNVRMIDCARWMARYYLCSVAEAMRLFMPGKSGLAIRSLYRAGAADAAGLDAPAEALYGYVAQRGVATQPQLRKAFPGVDLEAALRQCLRAGALVKAYEAQRKAAEKTETYLCSAPLLAADDVQALLARRPAQRKLLAFLEAHGEVSLRSLKAAGFSAPAAKALAEAGLARLEARRVLRDSYAAGKAGEVAAFVLNDEQQSAVAKLTAATDAGSYAAFLLHGITGSGKTLVYLEAVQRVRARGRAAVVLVPEIGLTGQMVRRFQERFAGDVIVMHSRLSLGERGDAVARVKRGEAGIVIGARSALFAPVDELGILILDEEHDASYKQDESPRYHTRDVARELARLHGAVLVLGSATPSVETYALAQRGAYTYLPLSRRASGAPLPHVEVVDMREELRLGRRGVLSNALRALVAQTLRKGEQMILLLNRRGFSTFVLCRECGHVMQCGECGLPLVYHRDGWLRCHFCDVRESAPEICPACGGRYIKYFGTGTQRLETELARMFPTARVARMDRDTTAGKFGHTEILTAFAAKRFDILLGTQMVAKGHDIENVTAVGIVSADSGLNLPDFRAAERCFALIAQAAGRAGRGHLAGTVVVQTYNPEHYAVAAAARHDYAAFYAEELPLRKALFYPPYSQLVKLVVQDKDEAAVQQKAEALSQAFRAALSAETHQILGPAPAAVAKLREVYRQTLLVKTKAPAEVRRFLLEQGAHLRRDIAIDVNPLQMF